MFDERQRRVDEEVSRSSSAPTSVQPFASARDMATPVRDRLGRPLRDLRVSITDRCNFRCPYCMPASSFDAGHAFLPRSELLSPVEIERIVQAAVRLGVRKVRITGGEPLVRPEVTTIVERIARLEGIEDLALTTNGSLLADYAQALRRAGLHRLTVSLDALDEPTFAAMSGGRGSLRAVLRGIEVAQAAGFANVRVNAVIRRGVNEHAIVPLARHFRGTGVVLRFIEYMDTGGSVGWSMDEVVTQAEMLRALQEAFGALVPVAPTAAGAVARGYRYADGQGAIGIIASVTHPFCGDCRRLRLSSDGRLYTCLFACEGRPLRPLLHDATAPLLQAAIRTAWLERSDRYSETRGLLTLRHRSKVAMSRLGG